LGFAALSSANAKATASTAALEDKAAAVTAGAANVADDPDSFDGAFESEELSGADAAAGAVSAAISVKNDASSSPIWLLNSI
jgi:hypothetical protein